MAPTSGACAQITVFIDPEKVDEFFKMFDAMLPKLKARPELLFFAVFTSPEEPGKITWIEQWSEPKEWLLEQLKQPHYQEYFAATAPLYVKPQVVEFLEPRGSPYIVSRE